MQALAARRPQGHFEPVGRVFSDAARWQVHSPAGRARHEQRAPVWMVFSEAAFSQVQWRAGFWPQLQVAWRAQAHSESPWRQQVEALKAVIVKVGV
ncbi:hypothetical protein BGC29_19475 [Acinetobacter baumannii]|nr:hypothetical protein BGC29_19475 [Acinetobacter baumannii]